ncbi:MAG: hypothetical protein ABH807_01850 [Candidatus Shapirobacteria bacterium]
MLFLIFVAALVLALIVEISVSGLNSISQAGEYVNGQRLFDQAYGCLEQGALNFLRNPGYTGESLQNDSISCTINLSNLAVDRQEISCGCQQNQRSRAVRIEVDQNQGVFTFSSIREQ